MTFWNPPPPSNFNRLEDNPLPPSRDVRTVSRVKNVQNAKYFVIRTPVDRGGVVGLWCEIQNAQKNRFWTSGLYFPPQPPRGRTYLVDPPPHRPSLDIFDGWPLQQTKIIYIHPLRPQGFHSKAKRSLNSFIHKSSTILGVTI